MDALKHTSSHYDIRAALKTLPNGLDETYERALLAVLGAKQQQVIRALTWLAFSLRPLELNELAEAIVIDLDLSPCFSEDRRSFNPMDAVSPIVGLVNIFCDDNKTELVEFAHFSIKEYILSDRIPDGPAKVYFLEEDHSNIQIARSCLSYCSYWAEKLFTGDQGRNHQYSKPPLRSYSSRYWATHIESVPSNKWPDALMELLLPILETNSSFYRVIGNWQSRDSSGSPLQ